MRLFNPKHYIALGELMVNLIDKCDGGKVSIGCVFKQLVKMLQIDCKSFDAKRFEWYIDNHAHYDNILNHKRGED